jgi:hypothetical protein
VSEGATKREKVCWYIPKERYVMTINSQDSEYVDLCAFSERDPELLARDSRSIVNNVVVGPVVHAHEILWRMAPTEDGWQTPIAKNRDLGHGDIESTLRITAKNAKPCESRITIRELPDRDGRIVDFP